MAQRNLMNNYFMLINGTDGVCVSREKKDTHEKTQKVVVECLMKE